MRKKKALFGIIQGDTAVVEAAAASGLELLKKEEREPLKTTSFGTGELIRVALDKGYRKFIIGLGGSAVNDCGAGILSALGAKLIGKDGNSVFPCGGELGKVAKIDLTGLDPRIRESEFQVACDVTNPLTGLNGASMVFGPQKGASNEMARILDQNLTDFAEVLKETTGIKVDDLPGAGAAGGIGAIMIAILKAKMRKGFELISEICDLENKIRSSDLIITAEGKTDFQTLSGKAPFGICQLGKKYGKPVVVLCGVIGEGGEEILQHGASFVQEIADNSVSKEDSIRNAAYFLEKCVEENILKWKEQLI